MLCLFSRVGVRSAYSSHFSIYFNNLRGIGNLTSWASPIFGVGVEVKLTWGEVGVGIPPLSIIFNLYN